MECSVGWPLDHGQQLLELQHLSTVGFGGIRCDSPAAQLDRETLRLLSGVLMPKISLAIFFFVAHESPDAPAQVPLHAVQHVMGKGGLLVASCRQSLVFVLVHLDVFLAEDEVPPVCEVVQQAADDRAHQREGDIRPAHPRTLRSVNYAVVSRYRWRIRGVGDTCAGCGPSC